MACRRSPGNQQNVGRAVGKPSERDLHRGRAEAVRDFGQLGRLRRGEAVEPKERRVNDPVAGAIVDQGVVLATAILYMFCRQTMSQIRRPSSIRVRVTLLSPMWRTRPRR